MKRKAIVTGLSLVCAGLPLTACEDPAHSLGPEASAPRFTVGSGVTATDFGPGGALVRGTFDAFKVKRVALPTNKHGWPHGRWEVSIEAAPKLDMGVRSFSYAPGAYTGWHTHPGPVFIQVLEGTVTFYEANDPDCNPIVVTAPGTFLDTGEHAHIGRNETGQPARDIVVLFAPEGAAFRQDAPDPGHCPFAS